MRDSVSRRTAICNRACSPTAAIAALLAPAALLISGCGYAGEPKPPALLRPMKVTELSATERGSKIVIGFLMPYETTEGLPINGSPDVEVRVGIQPEPWNQDTWRANSERVPVPEPRASAPAPKPAPAARAASGAKSASGKHSLFGFAKSAASRPPAPAKVIPNKAALVRTVTVDAEKYAGKTVVVGILVHGPKNRDDGWSITHLDVVPLLPVPRDLRAVDAPNVVHLQWNAAAPMFRIFRKQPADNSWTLIGETTQPSFDDPSPVYGKVEQYRVESARKAGDGVMESDPSDAYSFTAADRFPPAVPGGLSVIAGTKSVELVWDPVTDADFAGYRIYRNGVRIATGLIAPAYSDTQVSVGSKYSYRVSAVDQAGNESEQCTAVAVQME